MPKWPSWLSSILPNRNDPPGQAHPKPLSDQSRESKIEWGGDLRKRIGRSFIELWLSRIAEICEKVPNDADPQIASFMCQLAVAACLQETGLRPKSSEADLDFGMEFVRTLWTVTPIGAKRRIKPEALEAMTPVSWRDPLSAWHNFKAAGMKAGFIHSIQEIYKENFPLLTEEDTTFLARLSPVLRTLPPTLSKLPVLENMSYAFLDAFHNAQISHYLGEIPRPLDDPKLAAFSKGIPPDTGGTATHMMRNVGRIYPVIWAHRSKRAHPPNVHHETLFPQLLSRDERLAGEWSKVTEWAVSCGYGQADLLESVLECTFLFSYEAAYQLFTCDPFIHASAERAPGFRADSNFTITMVPDLPQAGSMAWEFMMRVNHHYALALPKLTDQERAELEYRNPSFIYLQLARIQGTHAVEATTQLDGHDEWSDSDE